MLGAYAKNFSKDVDELYHYMDSDKNGTLDLIEAKAFMVELQKIATEDRKGNFKGKFTKGKCNGKCKYGPWIFDKKRSVAMK